MNPFFDRFFGTTRGSKEDAKARLKVLLADAAPLIECEVQLKVLSSWLTIRGSPRRMIHGSCGFRRQ